MTMLVLMIYTFGFPQSLLRISVIRDKHLLGQIWQWYPFRYNYL